MASRSASKLSTFLLFLVVVAVPLLAVGWLVKKAVWPMIAGGSEADTVAVATTPVASEGVPTARAGSAPDPAPYAEPLYPTLVEHGNRSGSGYINRRGDWVIQPTLWGAGRFSEGMAAAMPQGRREWGYIDSRGVWIVPPQFADAGPFLDGRALVRRQPGGEPVFIDRRGAVRIRGYDECDSFSGGLARVRKGELWGFIDTAGVEVVPPRFEEARPFSEGLAAVMQEGLWGFVDSSGALVIEPAWPDSRDFAEGTAPVFQEHESGEGGAWGYIDRVGGFVIPPAYSEALPFSEERAVVEIGDSVAAYIAPSGTVLFQIDTRRRPPFDPPSLRSFSEGFGRIDYPVDGDYQIEFLDRDFEHVLRGHSSPSGFRDGLAAVNCSVYGDGECFDYIDTSGRYVWRARDAYLTDERYLNVRDAPPEELRLLRNEILARHGQSFAEPDLREHFKTQPWYDERPAYEVPRDSLSLAELTVLERIERLEQGQ